MSRARYSLRRRIVLAIVGTVLATSLIFGLTALIIAYSLEDGMFRRALTEEVARQQAIWRQTGALAVPQNPDVSIHPGNQPLPADIVQEFRANPEQTEFYGAEGRHYHILRFELRDHRSQTAAMPAVAVIEASRDLLVRPYRDSIIQFLAWMSLIIALIMAGFAWWLINRAMKPLSRLASEVANAEATIPVVQASHYPLNEIGLVAEALEQAFARIRGFVDREQAFTRDASHELRTPLAVVRGAAEVMALNRDLPANFVEPLRRIGTATTDMTLALDQLLALARENKGVVREPVALRPMIDKAIAWSRVRHPAATNRVTIAVDGELRVLVHPTSLQLVLNNLLGNCFQHAGQGELVIEFTDRHLAISDDGPGLALDVDAFAPFAKGSNTGSGLGLDITRRLCDAAGIGLTVGVGLRGHGTRFCLELENVPTG
jgi:signal transduction histidine kinase